MVCNALFICFFRCNNNYKNNYKKSIFWLLLKANHWFLEYFVLFRLQAYYFVFLHFFSNSLGLYLINFSVQFVFISSPLDMVFDDLYKHNHFDNIAVQLYSFLCLCHGAYLKIFEGRSRFYLQKIKYQRLNLPIGEGRST